MIYGFPGGWELQLGRVLLLGEIRYPEKIPCENIVGKGKNVGNQYFLLYPQQGPKNFRIITCPPAILHSSFS